MKNWKKTYPPSEGWIRAELTMKSNQIADPDVIKRICSAGHPKDYEFPVIEQHGSRVVCIHREKRKESEVPA